MTVIRFEVSRPVTDWEMSDIRQAIEAILEARSFFYAGDGELGDEIRAFLVDNPIHSNLELVEE
jgi:hypothetical protein